MSAGMDDADAGGGGFDPRPIYSFDLGGGRTAHIPAATREEAAGRLDAYLSSEDEEGRFQFELRYVERADSEEEGEGEEEGREGLAELVRAILAGGDDGAAN